MDELQISGKRFISSRRIARDNGYTSDYIGQLIRGGKVIGQKVGRAWYVDAISFDAYVGQEGASANPADQKSSDLPSSDALRATPASQTFAQQDLPSPITTPVVVEEQKAKIEEKVAEKKEEPHHVPLHIVKAEAPAGLRYYSDDRPNLPEIREIPVEKNDPPLVYPDEETKSISNDVFAPQSSHRRVRPLRAAGLTALGLAVFMVSALVSSSLSLNLSIEEGNTASAYYSLPW